MEETSILYGIEANYALIGNNRFGLIKEISKNLLQIRKFESHLAIINELSK